LDRTRRIRYLTEPIALYKKRMGLAMVTGGRRSQELGLLEAREEE